MVSSSKKKKKPTVNLDVEEVEDVVSKITGVPITSSEKDNAKRILGLQDNLDSAVIGQLDAVKCISDSLTRSAARIQNPKKPIGSFLFLGTTGVGKTYLAKRLAHEMFDSEDHIIQIDMSELMEGHSVSKLIGSPPGYIGYNKGGKLTEAMRLKKLIQMLFISCYKYSRKVKLQTV
jgi:ATP-dependent Clp protease ATP-binding subunit ClpB